MSKDERYFVSVNNMGGNTTWIGVDYEKVNAEGRYETLGSLRARVNDDTHKAVILKGKSTTREQNYEGYHKCNKCFNKVALDLKVREVYDERERVSSKIEQTEAF